MPTHSNQRNLLYDGCVGVTDKSVIAWKKADVQREQPRPNRYSLCTCPLKQLLQPGLGHCYFFHVSLWPYVTDSGLIVWFGTRVSVVRSVTVIIDRTTCCVKLLNTWIDPLFKNSQQSTACCSSHNMCINLAGSCFVSPFVAVSMPAMLSYRSNGSGNSARCQTGQEIQHGALGWSYENRRCCVAGQHIILCKPHIAFSWWTNGFTASCRKFKTPGLTKSQHTHSSNHVKTAFLLLVQLTSPLYTVVTCSIRL